MSITANAYDYCCVDGIYFFLNNSDKTAGVERPYSSITYEGSIKIPSTITYNGTQYRVTNINSRAFAFCSLTSITIPNSVTYIGRDAFRGCCLPSITIPNSVTYIGSEAFAFCSLTSIQVEKGNSVFDSRNNCNAIIETEYNTLITGCKNTVIPNSVTGIGSSAFMGCTGLNSITIPNSVTWIGRSAFYDCTGLNSITIPNSVMYIYTGAFSYCI